MEIFFLISLERIDVESDTFKESKVSYLEALTFLQDIEYICIKSGLALSQKIEKDESTARSILQSIYPTSSGSITWWSLVLFIKQLLPHISDQIRTFFFQLFIQQTPNRNYNRFVKPSYLLNNQQFIYIALGNSYIQSATSIGLLWGNAHFGWNFKSLYQAIMNFDGSTFFLMKLEDKSVGKSSIIGAFNKKKWLDQGIYQGNEECYLMQLTPKFKIFAAQRFRRQFANESDLDTQNYCYLHYFDENIGDGEEDKERLNEVAPSGLGFGGILRKDFRLWIDYKDMQNLSYVSEQDETYRCGSLVDPVMKNCQLTYLEVWGIGKDNEVLSTQLLVEKAKQIEFDIIFNHILLATQKLHREVISIMKQQNGGDFEDKQEQQVFQTMNDKQSSRKEKILHLSNQDDAVKVYDLTNGRSSTAFERSKSQGVGSRYLKPSEIEPARKTTTRVTFADEKPVPLGFRNTQFMSSQPYEDDSNLIEDINDLNKNTDEVLNKYQKQ